MNPLIINRPELQSTGQRVIYPVITFIFWILWIYIWLPLLSLIAWGFGVQLFYDEMILENGAEVFFKLAGNYAMIIILMTAVLLSWAQYNWVRFRKKERRRVAKTLSPEEVAEYFQVNTEELMAWHDAKRVVVKHNERGDVERVEC